MNATEEEINLFDDLLSGTAEGKAAFNKALTNDPSLAQKLIDYQNFKSAFEASEILAFKNKLSSWEHESSSKTNVFKLWFGAIAAGLAIIFGVSYFFFPSPSKESLIAGNFTPYDNVITVRGNKVDMDDAMNAYQHKDYQKAIEFFQELPKNELSVFYLGESYMALKKYDKAIEIYRQFSNPDHGLYEVNTFHLALAYFANSDDELAKKLFEKIEEEQGEYASQATALLRYL
jgi:tetratricopeptide (TPR) repeat protein